MYPLFFCGHNAGGRFFFLHFHFFPFFCHKGGSGGHIVNNGIVIHHLIMIWQMLAPSPFSASSSLSILRSAKLSRTPPVGLIRAVCLCEAAGALGAAGARHCQWTESLTLPGSRTLTHDPRSPCYCFHLNPLLPVSLPECMCAHLPPFSVYFSCFVPLLSQPNSLCANVCSARLIDDTLICSLSSVWIWGASHSDHSKQSK